MRFLQLDKITELNLGKSLTAVKCLSLSEQYLHDHFPLFPVMPGVLMLEAIYQAGAFLVKATEDFQHSMVVLQEAKNLKYQGFVAPGDELKVEISIIKQDEKTVTLKAAGTIEGKPAVSGRIVLEKFNLAERNGEDPEVDENLRHSHRQVLNLLTGRGRNLESGSLGA